jgi:hypothetical protein
MKAPQLCRAFILFGAIRSIRLLQQAQVAFFEPEAQAAFFERKAQAAFPISPFGFSTNFLAAPLSKSS